MDVAENVSGVEDVLGDDINVISLAFNFIAPELKARICYAMARLHVIFITMPWAHKIHVFFGEKEPYGGFIRPQMLFNPCYRQSLACRATLMQTEIAIGIIFAIMPKYTHLVVTYFDDLSIAISKL
jgi:hypothetical protein